MHGKTIPTRPKRSVESIFTLRICEFLNINIWFFPVSAFLVCGGCFAEFAAAYSIALIHELAHIITAGLFGVGISRITVYPFGISASLSDGYIPGSYKEFFTALAGPLSNAALFFPCLFLYRLNGAELLFLCAKINAAMCLLNLIPALPLDGGRMLKSVLSFPFGIIRAYNITLRFSRIPILCIVCTALLVFFVNDFNFSLLLVSAFLLQNLCSEQKNLTIITVREILNRKSEYKKMWECRTKTLCVTADTPARSILRHLSFDRACVIHVIDHRGTIFKTLTEARVLSALCNDGIRISYGSIS